jgi:hypothetical protein
MSASAWWRSMPVDSGCRDSACRPQAGGGAGLERIDVVLTAQGWPRGVLGGVRGQQNTGSGRHHHSSASPGEGHRRQAGRRSSQGPSSVARSRGNLEGRTVHGRSVDRLDWGRRRAKAIDSSCFRSSRCWRPRSPRGWCNPQPAVAILMCRSCAACQSHCAHRHTARPVPSQEKRPSGFRPGGRIDSER